MDPIREHIEQLTRRHFFGRTGLSLGAVALSTLLAEAARSDTAPKGGLTPMRHVDRRSARSAPFSAESQTRDLFVHERRPVADGLV